MAMVGVVYWQPVQADPRPKSSGLVLGRRPLGAVLHSSNEPGELSQWLCHDDITINIVLDIIISPYSVAFGVILSLLFLLFCLFVCTVEDISTRDGAIGVKFWLRVEQTSWTGTR